jgi:hypothetical protein
MKNRFKYALIPLFLLCLIACSTDSDPIEAVPFEGNWSGTFDGGDSGSWTITVRADGSLTGQAFSNNAQLFLMVEGDVNTSGATAGSAQNGATFEGTFLENTSSGTWENAAEQISGNWVGSRD